MLICFTLLLVLIASGPRLAHGSVDTIMGRVLSLVLDMLLSETRAGMLFLHARRGGLESGEVGRIHLHQLLGHRDDVPDQAINHVEG